MSARGFSQKTGLPAAIAATTYSSWLPPHEATRTASTSGSRDQVDPGGVHPGRDRQAPGHVPGAGGVHVVHGDDLRTGDHLGQPPDVVLADHAGTDHADPHGHLSGSCHLSRSDHLSRSGPLS